MTTHETGARGLTLVALLAIMGSGVDPLQSLYRMNRDGLDALSEGDAERAASLFEQARELAPDDPRLAYNLATALSAAGRLDEAASAYDAAAEAEAVEVARDAHFNRGLMELEREAPAAAIESFSQALMLDPSDEEARRNLEIALNRLPPPPPEQSAPQEGESDEDSDSESENENRSESQEGDSEEAQEAPEGGQQDGEKSDESDRGDGAPPEESQRSEEGGEDGEPEPGEESRSEERDGAEGSAGKEAKPKGGDAEMAERVLKALAKAEEEALRRALGRRLDEEVPASGTEKDW